MDDPLDSALSTRRFQHGKSKSKPGRGGARAAKPFNPLSTLGRYEINLGSSGTGAAGAASFLEIHELTTDEDGLIGTFDLGNKLRGMFVLAGSRKGLALIVRGLEMVDDEDEEDEEESEGEGEAKVSEETRHDDASSEHEVTAGPEDEDEDADEEVVELSAMELEDERINRRARAFEKNSFRNPKFWMRWKGRPVQSENDRTTPPVDTDMGYLVFSSNSCERFDGTISCPSLGWENVKLKGRKIHSRATPCSMSWNE